MSQPASFLSTNHSQYLQSALWRPSGLVHETPGRMASSTVQKQELGHGTERNEKLQTHSFSRSELGSPLGAGLLSVVLVLRAHPLHCFAQLPPLTFILAAAGAHCTRYGTCGMVIVTAQWDHVPSGAGAGDVRLGEYSLGRPPAEVAAVAVGGNSAATPEAAGAAHR